LTGTIIVKKHSNFWAFWVVVVKKWQHEVCDVAEEWSSERENGKHEQ